jgi:hypothetical protein
MAGPRAATRPADELLLYVVNGVLHCSASTTTAGSTEKDARGQSGRVAAAGIRRHHLHLRVSGGTQARTALSSWDLVF